MDYEFARSFLEPDRHGNFLHDMHPLNKANMFFVLGVAAFIVPGYWYGFAAAILFLVIASCGGIFRSFASIYLKVAFLFVAFLFVVRACFTPGEQTIYRLWGIHLTWEGIDVGLKSASIILAFSGAFILFMKLTPISKLMHALEKRGESHSVSFVAVYSFQSIIDLNLSAKVILDSQKARGIETEGNLYRRLRAFIPVVGPLVLNAIANTEEKSIAMDARAFSAPVKHTFLRELPAVQTPEKILVAVCDILFVALIVWRVALWMS